MDIQILNFCELIKKTIFSKDQVSLQGDVDWTNLVQLSKEHNMLALFVEGASKYYSYISRPEYEQEMKQSLGVVAAQIRRTTAFLQLYESFIAEGIHPIVMKGLICRELYGELADHRPSGDEDILIRPCEYEQAKRVLTSNGYVAELEVETEMQLEKVQEISFIHPKDRLHIELHLNPMGRENDVRSKMSDCFINVFENYRDVEIDGVCIRTMSHQDHLLFLILHAFKHFIGGGFGIRQMLDILLYQERYGRAIDVKQIYEILKKFRAETFWNDMIHIGNNYFGFSLQAIQEPHCVDELFEDMIQCGTFGNNTPADRTAERTIKFATGNHLKNRKSNTMTMLWRALFPKRVFLLDNSPYLAKKPWLLPVAWVQRWWRFIRRTHNSEENLVTESMKISRRRIKLLKKYDLV